MGYRDHIYESAEYRRVAGEEARASKALLTYKDKYLNLREAIREYFRGNVSEDDLKYLAGWRGE